MLTLPQAIIPVEVGPKTSTGLMAWPYSAGTFRGGPAALCGLPATRRELIEAGVAGSVSDN